ncbi:MAG: hypothetical protein OXN89_08465 [Bryobacterales bacterium]|nr:hypothetical protein [Bryobacterales bacterium]
MSATWALVLAVALAVARLFAQDTSPEGDAAGELRMLSGNIQVKRP